MAPPLTSRRRWGAVGIVALLCLGTWLFAGSRSGVRPSSGSAFYYWKTQFKLSPSERAALRDLPVTRLYIRFFDVSWDAAMRRPYPRARIEFQDLPPAGVAPVPVVYIQNEVFQRIAADSVGALADNVWNQVRAIAERTGMRFREAQLDCDWTDCTRERYFAFLERLGRLAAAEDVVLSATIRLHQVKYRGRTGIPPVARGMVMFYNMGEIGGDEGRMSIFNRPDAEKYAAHLASYPLPFDIALPVFSWSVQVRDGRVVGLLEKIAAADLEGNPGFSAIGERRYRAGESFFLHGAYFRKGDEVVVEDTGPGVTLEAATLASRNCPRSPLRQVTFFDFDERRLRRYAKSDLDRAAALFH